MSTTSPIPVPPCEELVDRDIVRVAIAIIDILLCVLALICNGAVLAILYKKPKLRNNANYHLLNLVIADLLYCLTLPLVAATDFAGGWNFGYITCQLHGFLILWFILAIELNFPVLAIYRFIVMLRLQNRFAEFYKTRTGYLFIATWTLAGLCALPPLIGWGHFSYCEESYHCFLTFEYSMSYVTFFIIATTVMPFLIMAICYMKVIITVRESSKRVQNSTNGKLSASVASLAVSDDHNAVRMQSPVPPVVYTDRDFLPLPPRQPPPKPVASQRRSSLASTTANRGRDSTRRFSIASIASSTMSNVRPSEQRLGRSLALITACYLFTWMPVVICILQVTFRADVTTDLYIHLIQLFLYLHVAMNPLVYGLLTDPLRGIVSRAIRRGRIELTQESTRWVPPSLASGVQQHPKPDERTEKSTKSLAWKENEPEPEPLGKSTHLYETLGPTNQPLIKNPVSVLSVSSNDVSSYASGQGGDQHELNDRKPETNT